MSNAKQYEIFISFADVVISKKIYRNVTMKLAKNLDRHPTGKELAETYFEFDTYKPENKEFTKMHYPELFDLKECIAVKKFFLQKFPSATVILKGLSFPIEPKDIMPVITECCNYEYRTCSFKNKGMYKLSFPLIGNYRLEDKEGAAIPIF